MPTYVIMSGVRRVKAAEIVGRTQIRAKEFHADGHLIDTRDISLSDLLSPKGTVDVRASQDLVRFLKLQSYLLAGVTLHPIEVEEGTTGYPLATVTVLR